MPALADIVVVRRAPLQRRMGGADRASASAVVAVLDAAGALIAGLAAVVAVAVTAVVVVPAI